MRPSAPRNAAMEAVRTVSMYVMIWIHFYQNRVSNFLFAPFDEWLGRIRLIGLAAFSGAIDCMMGLSGYFGIASPRISVRRILR
jgi:hypothetical protein